MNETTSSTPSHRALKPFFEKHRKDVMGILHCCDRLRLPGSLRYLYNPEIFEEYLAQAKVLYKHFKSGDNLSPDFRGSVTNRRFLTSTVAVLY